ncbi:putative quinol monooxygenase [Streptomyces griseocarneus]|uniref:putative quinol monooxygenase n=1 Tax=Streptomyces griseocarneus TaxID=51201 RepID=UPI00167DFEED|nr:putative quinol monooxygenase [Streptomyces griseocarneus]MBZ6474299.1 antibiotic biosynthesis monooxygenase [Streptomyces griseocarneus]GHG53168.1 antibiotic biosynthesis monooxygenase [Streptomyces griseocarneus]
MIFIAVKFTIRPERSARWLEDVAEFTRATREEPGNVFYEWSKSVDDEHQYVLLEAFESAEAGEVHVNSEHFKTAMAWMPDAVAETPQIINVEVPGTGWSAMAEVSPRA